MFALPMFALTFALTFAIDGHHSTADCQLMCLHWLILRHPGPRSVKDAGFSIAGAYASPFYICGPFPSFGPSSLFGFALVLVCPFF